MPQRDAARCVFLAFATLLMGCAESVEFGEVAGVVLLDKKPLGNVQIEFLPETNETTDAPRSTAFTDEQGRYELRSDDERLGALVGKHRVIVRDLQMYDEKFVGRGVGRGKAEPDEAAAAPKPLPRFDKSYSNVASTPLLYEVKPGKQSINVELSSGPGTSK